MARYAKGLQMPSKHPDAVRCINFNAVGWLKGDTIDKSTVTAENITVDSSSEAGGIITMSLSGGTNGNTGKITVSFTTDTTPAKTEVAVFWLPIDNLEGRHGHV